MNLTKVLSVCLTTFTLALAVADAQTKTATTTTLAVTSGGSAVTSVASGSVVTLTASVKAGATAVTPGQVKFCDASANYCTDIHLLGTAQLTSAGTAVFKFRPAIGGHSYKAVFVGTNSDSGSTSGAAALTVTGLAPTATSIAQSGSTGNYTLTATVSGIANTGPTGTVSFLDTSNNNSVLETAELGVSTAGLNFLNSSNPATGQYSYSIAAGDFNGDGIPDLAVTNSANNNLTILLGDGSGNFTATATSPSTGVNPYSVAAGDFNGDGILDLAVANFDPSGGISTATILLGNGDGTFTAAPAGPAEGTLAAFIAVGDFNGDGILDLAVVNALGGSAPGTVTILLGKGDGTFTPATASPATGNSPFSVAVGDFNGDGIQDLAVANSGSTNLTILLGNGDGTFTPAAMSPATGNEPTSIAVGDFNGDGILDLAVTNYGSINSDGVTILLGNGNGTFTSATSLATGIQPYSIAIGDFNGDGIPDLAVANNASLNVTVMLGNGNGTFAATQVNSQMSSNPQFVSAGDFTGTGRTDLAVAVAYPNSTGNLTVLLAENQTATATASGISVGPTATGTHLVVANYPGDSGNAASTSATTGLSAMQGTPTVNVAASANPATYGSVVLTATVAGSGLTPTGTVSFLSGGSTQLGTGTLNANGVAAFTASSLAVGSYSITAKYAGDTDYIAATSTPYSLTVNQATPTINWTNPAAITYGTVLGAAQLNASSSVAGSFSYSPAAGTVLKAGSQNLSVTFTPTDTTDYQSATATVTLTVNQALPTINWATPAAITSGTALSATQLDATASVPGSLVYSPAAGTTPVVGSDTLSVTFTPTDTIDYTTATATVTLAVNNPVPVMGSMTPAVANAGGAAFTLTVNGAGFVANSTIQWGTIALTTTFVSSSQLTAQVTAADIATAGAYAVTVQTPAPVGGTSGILQFEVDSAAAGTSTPIFSTVTATVTPGQTASYQVALPAGTTVTSVSCLNFPTGSSCSYAAGTVTITTSSTTPAGTYQVTVVFNVTESGTASADILLPILLLPLMFLRKKLAARGIWITACLGLVLMAATAFVCAGCGGGGSNTQTHQVTSAGVVGLTVQ
jgi:hypothetical protein